MSNTPLSFLNEKILFFPLQTPIDRVLKDRLKLFFYVVSDHYKTQFCSCF